MGDFQQGRQASVDRLKRRINNYRVHSNTSGSHLESTASVIYGDQHKQTVLLKQRYVESKAKKSTKKSDNRKQESAVSNSISSMGQSKLLARGHDQAAGPGDSDGGEPAAKKQKAMNGAMSTSMPSDISNFQIVHQLQTLKNNAALKTSVPTSSVSSMNPTQSLESLGTSLVTSEANDSIKKENEIDLPADSLLDDFSEFSNFEDIDMGINLEDFVHDLDLDNIKHENSNSCVDTFFKEEVGDTLFNDDQSSISNNDVKIVNANTTTNTGSIPKAVASTSDTPAYNQYSNSASQPTAPVSFPPASFSCQSTHSFCSTVASTPSSMASSYIMTNSLPKVRMNVNNIRQNDMVQASQTLKQMAEPYQTKVSPISSTGRPNINEYNYNLGNNSLINHPTSVPGNQAYSTMNQNVSMYNQSMDNEMELKHRQQMMQSYSRDMQQSPADNQSQNNQLVGSNIQPTQGVPQPKQPVQQPAHQAQSQVIQQTMLSQQPQQQQKPQQSTQHQIPLSNNRRLQTSSSEHQVPQAQMMQQKTVQQPNQQSQQQQIIPPQSNQQVPSGRNSLSPFSNQLSPMNYNHPQQMQTQMPMNSHYANMCAGMPTNSVHCSYPMGARGSSPMGQGAVSNIANPNGPQPRFLQQQMMSSMNMMRSQMVVQQGQMMARPPPPEYRQAAMMQQQQPMMAQPMPQTMGHMQQGSGQMMFQMRPGMRQSPASGIMVGGQMISGMNQQVMPVNVPSMDQTNGMNVPVSMSNPMVQNIPGATNLMPGNNLPVTMNQGPGPGGQPMGMVISRSAMMQRMRPQYNSGMSTAQMPPANRGEWRSMMMHQQHNPGVGMMMGSDVRHVYPQKPEDGMMGQSGPIMSVQRGQGPIMAMRRMPSSASLGGGVPGGNISVTHNAPRGASLPMGGVRMPQHSIAQQQQQHAMCSAGQTQGPQVAQDSRNTPGVMNAQSHIDNSSVAMPQRVQTNSPNLGQLPRSGASTVVGQMGNVGNQTSINSMPPIPQNGTNGGMQVPRNPTPNPSSINPGSPITMCQRPLSNPNVGVGSPVLACSSPSTARPPPTQGRQGLTPSTATAVVRPSHMHGQMNANMGVQVPMQPNQSMRPILGSPSMCNPNQACVRPPSLPQASDSLLPENPGGQSGNVPSSADDDFDLIFNDGEFAALLS